MSISYHKYISVTIQEYWSIKFNREAGKYIKWFENNGHDKNKLHFRVKYNLRGKKHIIPVFKEWNTWT